MTDGDTEWTETSWSVDPGVDASPPTFTFRVPTAKEMLEQTRRTFETLPALEDRHQDNQNEPAFSGWIELKDGKQIQFSAQDEAELDAKLGAACRKYGERVRSSGQKLNPRHIRREVHPLRTHRDRIAHALALSDKLFEEHGHEKSIVSAWHLGFELGLACLNYERQTAIPKNFRVAEMDQAKAGSKPKRRKQEHLNDALARWMQERGVSKEDANKALLGEFWDFAKRQSKSFKCSGKERTGTIKHLRDAAGYSCQHLARNVVPALRKMIQ